MKQFYPGLLIAASTLLLAASAGAATTDAKASYEASKDQATQDYKVAREKCNSFAGNDKSVCVAEAEAAETRAKDQAEAQYKNTPAATASARKDIAAADYKVAKAKCDSKAGNDKDVCIKEAKAARVAAVDDAKADKTVVTARADAQDDKQTADYKVALQKCDSLANTAKDNCIASAKAQYNQ